MTSRKAIVVGISGCSSSGKTTLARLLRDIFPRTFILHEDDFYKPEDELPVKDGLVDWDCAESISVPDMVKSLRYIRNTGTFPPELDSKEDQNSVGQCPVSNMFIEAMKQKVAAWLHPGQPGHNIARNPELRLCIMDGFLLYTPQMRAAVDLIDIKLFLLVSRAKATQRRDARDGYVTLEGFWKDPPGYVDKIVWPNYVEAHNWLFEGQNVEGRLNRSVLEAEGIQAQVDQRLDVDMTTTLKWAVDTLMRELERVMSEVNPSS